MSITASSTGRATPAESIPVPGPATDAFASDIPSAVTEAECRALARLAGGQCVLEVGSERGRSTIALASTARVVHAIDWHKGDPHAGHGDTACEFFRNLDRYQARDRVVAHVGRFEAVAPVLAPRSFGMAFVDGYHTEDETWAYARRLEYLIVAGGVLVFHDYYVPDHPHFGVKAVVDQVYGDRIVKVIGSMAIVHLKGST